MCLENIVLPMKYDIGKKKYVDMIPGRKDKFPVTTQTLVFLLPQTTNMAFLNVTYPLPHSKPSKLTEDFMFEPPFTLVS